MTEPLEKSTQKTQKTITTGQIAAGVVGGLTLFLIGLGALSVIFSDLSNFNNEDPALKAQNETFRRNNEAVDQVNEKLAKNPMDCDKYISICTTITSKNFIEWPFTSSSPVTVTCKKNSLKFIQVEGRWYERSGNPKYDDIPSWTEVQKNEGLGSSQNQEKFNRLEEKIAKACY